MRKNLLLVAAAMAWCGLSSLLAQAQPAYEANFDTTFPSFGYGYGYSGYGASATSVDPPPYTAINTNIQTPSTFTVPTVDNPGPPAATATLDTTNWAIPPDATYVYAGVGLGIGFGFPEGMRPTSGDLSQYKVTFDVKLDGYNPLDDGLRAKMLIIFQGPGFAAEEYTIGVNDTNLGQFPEVPLLTSTTQTFSHPLSDFAFIGSNWDFTTLFATTTQVLVQVEPYLTSATTADEIGLDNDNVLTIDNVKIEGPFAEGLQGDFDGDQDVDGNDFIVWQRGQSPGGMVAEDLTDWKNNFGTQPMAAAALGAVPEPGCFALVGAGALALLTAGRRGVRRTQRRVGSCVAFDCPPSAPSAGAAL